MPSQKSKSKIMDISRKQLLHRQALMRPAVNESNHKVENLVAKGASKSNHVPTSKGMKQPIASSFQVEKQKAKSMSRVNEKDGLKEAHALQRKQEVDDASGPTNLKAMLGLVLKTTDRLGHFSDSSTRLKNRASDKEEDATSAKYRTTKLELPKDIDMVHKDSCTIEGNERLDEIAIDKENVEQFGEYHKGGDTMKAKHTQDSILSDIHCNLLSISSYSFGKDPPEFQRGEANCLSKKRKRPFFEENPKALDDGSNVGQQVSNKSCKQTKKLRHSDVTRKDEEHGGSLHRVSAEDDTISVSKNDHAKVSMSSRVKQQCYSCSKPIDKPTWSGIFKTNDKKYVPLDGHLSTKSCEKAWNLSKQLRKVVELTKLSRLEVWPKALELSTPTSDDIGIFLFPHKMRQDKGLDQLVREVTENDLALRAIIGEAEMLIFPSILLPNHHQTFQRKHYLWGVFKHREDKGVVVEEPLNAMGHCEKEKQKKVVSDQPNHVPLVETNQEMSRMVSTIQLERHMLSANKRTQEVEASHLKEPTNKGFALKALGEEEGQTEDAHVATNVDSFSACHGQIHSSMGHPPGRLMGFVVQKTPKLDRIIREIEQEGALVFSMQGDFYARGDDW